MPPALLFESSGQFRFVHRSQLNKRQTQVWDFKRKPGNASRAEGSFIGIYKRARLQAPLEMPGNDPGASYMQSMRSPTELHPHALRPPVIVRTERAFFRKLRSL